MIRLTGATGGQQFDIYTSETWTSNVVLGWTPQSHVVTHNKGKKPVICRLYYGNTRPVPGNFVVHAWDQSNTRVGFIAEILDENSVRFDVYRLDSVPHSVYARLFFLA